MASGVIAAVEIAPGRTEDARAIARQATELFEARGAQVWWREELIGGAVGTVYAFTVYPGLAARASAMDGIIGDRVSSPVAQAMAASDPPSRTLRRSFVTTLNPDEPSPTPRPVELASIFVPTAATRAEAEAVLAASTQRLRGVGYTATTWRVESGEFIGSFLLILGSESMAEFYELRSKNRALPDPPPIPRAEQAGVFTWHTTITTVPFEV